MVETVVYEYFPSGDFEKLRDEILRLLAVEIELDRDNWAILGEDGLIDHIIERAYEVYRRKESLIAEPLYNIIKRIKQSDEENQPKKIQVIFTDGIRRMRIIVDVDKAEKNKGKEVTRSLERSSILSTIDNKWMEHLRELDSVKEGIGLRSFGQNVAPIWRECCTRLARMLHPCGENATPMWRECCAHLASTLRPFGENAALIW